MICQLLHLYLDVDPGRQAQAGQGFDGLLGRLDDVDQPLMDPHLVLVTGILMHESRAVHGVFALFGRQRYGAKNLGAAP